MSTAFFDESGLQFYNRRKEQLKNLLEKPLCEIVFRLPQSLSEPFLS
jgi:hypothetical protein